MIERLQCFFNEFTGRTDVVITEKTRLDNEDFNISSFALIQMVCALEDEFDVEIPNSAIKKFKTVKDVINFLEKNT